jgi:ubiquinone/menaquinone biosynthesis C-methylase UbiE
MLNNYDKVARYYDNLSRILFRKSQVNAQIKQLEFIPPQCKILIAGGGTGWILEELSKTHPQGLSITYVEISAEMIRLAKKRNPGKNEVEFVNCAIEEFDATDEYDIIHTAFLFDNFAPERTALVFSKLDKFLKADGLWLYTDFSYQRGIDKKWKGFLLKMMYGFFRKMADVEAKTLPNMSVYFDKGSYLKIQEKDYYSKFIKAIIYKKLP